MASFNAGANAFLNSPHRVKIMGPNPVTERGATTVINAHPKEPRIIYPSGKFIIIRNIEDPTDCFVYRGHAHTTTAAKFSPNGFWVCSADVSGKVRVWAWDNPEHLTKLETPVFAGPVYDVDWDNESKKIVAVGDGSGIQAKVFTWDTGNSAGELVGHNKRILSVAYKPTRPFRIMTGSEDMKTVFFSGPPFKFTHSNAPHTNFVNMVRYSPDGNSVVSVGSDKKIQFYDGATGLPTKEISAAHDGSIFAASFSPDSSKLVTCSADKTLKIWSVADATLVRTIQISADPQINDMQQSVLWMGDNLISLSLNGNINIYSATDAEAAPRRIEAHQGSITSMCLDRDASMLYTGSTDGVVIARNLATGATQKVTTTDKKNLSGGAHNGKVVGLALNNGELTSVGWDDTARFASLSTLAYYQDVSLAGQPIALASSGSLAAVVTNAEIALFRGQSKVASLGSLGFSATSIAILDEQEIAVGGEDNKVHIYSITDGNTITPANVIEGRAIISALAYSPDSSLLAVGDAGRQIEVYERSSWSPTIKGKWVFHTSKISTLSWSPSGALLASGSTDENIFIWNLASPMTRINFPFAHMGGVTGVGWVNESSLVSVGSDHVVVTWNVPASA